MRAASVLGFDRRSSAATAERQTRIGQGTASVLMSILVLAANGTVYAQRVWVEHGPGPNTQGSCPGDLSAQERNILRIVRNFPRTPEQYSAHRRIACTLWY